MLPEFAIGKMPGTACNTGWYTVVQGGLRSIAKLHNKCYSVKWFAV